MLGAKTIIYVSILIALIVVPSGCAQEQAQRVELESEGWKLIGDLQMPGSDQPVPAVLLCHQFNKERSVYKKLASELAERGIASLSLDLRGHGESTNKGGISRDQLNSSWPDVVAGFKYLQNLEGVDAARIGVLGASYSAEAIAVAGREHTFGKAYVSISGGMFSAESISALDGSGAAWLLIAARDDSGATQISEKAANACESAELIIYESGGHGVILFEKYPDLESKIADWFAGQLK